LYLVNDLTNSNEFTSCVYSASCVYYSASYVL